MRLLTVQETAQVLSIKASTVKRWIKKGRIRGIKLGVEKQARVRVPDVWLIADLEQFGFVSSSTRIWNREEAEKDYAAAKEKIKTLQQP